jgi:hypothetical protein
LEPFVTGGHLFEKPCILDGHRDLTHQGFRQADMLTIAKKVVLIIQNSSVFKKKRDAQPVVYIGPNKGVQPGYSAVSGTTKGW